MTRNFEVFTGRFVRAPKSLSVSVSKRGIIGFYQRVHAALGSPDCVRLLFDRSTDTAGLQKAACAEPHVYPVKRQSAGRSYRVHAGAFCKAYGFGPKGNAPLIFTPALEGDTLILESSKAVTGYFRVRNAKGRRKEQP